MQFTPRKHRLKQVTCIHRAFSPSSADYRMQFVNEEYNPSFITLNLLQDCFKSLFKFSPIFCAGNQSAHIETEYCSILETFRDVAAHDSVSQTLNNRSLTHSGVSYKNRVVLSLP